VAQTYTLEAEARSVIGKKVGQLRAKGIVPAVIYGAKVQPVHVQIPARALQNTLMKAGGTHLIDIAIAGQKPLTVLARHVQRHIIRGDILHVDFFAVDAATKIEAQVPIQIVGTAPAVSARLGILLNGIATVRIEALPSDLIDSVQVDVSTLKDIGDTIYVRDLNMGAKVTIVDDGDEMLVRVIPTPASVSQDAAASEITSAEPEVISKGKKDEEGDE
jgi:large subunit ribosomal protein L25